MMAGYADEGAKELESEQDWDGICREVRSRTSATDIIDAPFEDEEHTFSLFSLILSFFPRDIVERTADLALELSSCQITTSSQSAR